MKEMNASCTMLGWVLWLLVLGGTATGVASARETSPPAEQEPGDGSRVEAAKAQALFQVQQDMNMRSILWFRPSGLVILVSQDQAVPLRLRTLAMEGVGKGKIEYAYSAEESKVLNQGGVIRVFSADHIESDLNLTAGGVIIDSDGKERRFSTSVGINHKRAPVVLELQVARLADDSVGLVPVFVEKSDASRLTGLFSRHLQFLKETRSYLEAAALLGLIQADKEGGPKDGTSWKMELASAYLHWNLHAKALPVLRELTREKGSARQVSLAWFYIGKLHYKDGDYDKALSAFSKAKMDLPPDHLPEILYLIGNCHLYQKSYRPALQSLDQVPAQSDFYPYALHSSGLAFLNQGDVEATKDRFGKLMKTNPGADDLLRLLIDRAHVTLGYFLVEQKMYEEAVVTFSGLRAGSLYEDQGKFGIGWALLNMGLCDRAAVVFNDLVSAWPASAYSEEARLKAGECYAQLGARRKAVESYQEALRHYSLKQDTLQSLEQDLTRIPLKDWLTVQREQLADTRKRNPLIRDLASESRVQVAIAEYETLLLLAGQVERIANSLDESLLTEAFKKRLVQMERQVEDEVKAALSREIAEIKKQVEKRAIQADIGLLRNFGMETP
jgi:tetratricopeptide (TPR) repeat protein